ncbi:Indoleamine 2,3-dioxygenase [Mycena vitilis]|nr:Indoleamine 2,3-dioxygenase [Mycena vitilis]
MNVVDLLPSPHQYFSLAVDLLQSTIANTRRPAQKRRSPVDFDVDINSGFFPRQPLPHLSGAYTIWEDALKHAGEMLSLGEDDSEEALSKRASGELWRSRVLSWPVIGTEHLCSNLRLLQRAHLVLAWLVHYYVHSAPPAASDDAPFVVPKSLAVPLVAISRHLGMAPVLTFADTVLWNWDLVDASLPVSIENMHFVNLFSGTEDERNFYTTSARAEFRGIEMLRIIDEYNNLPNLFDWTSISKVARDLGRLTGIINDISDIIQGVRAVVDPHVFYWDLRPWFEGSDAKGPSAPGWIYEGVPNSDQLDLSGPSAGQSSVMHALDIFLDVDHKLRQRRSPAPSDENKRADHGFMDRMRRYMPGKHREYLASLAATPRSIRDLAQQTPALREPYDGAVMALKKLRDLHMRIACLYVVTMSRSTPDARAGCPVASMMDRLQSSRAARNGPTRGTGGNELALLLKAGRDATRRTLLKEN